MVQKAIKTFTDVVCPFCGSLCDDLEVDICDDEVIEVRNAWLIFKLRYSYKTARRRD